MEYLSEHGVALRMDFPNRMPACLQQLQLRQTNSRAPLIGCKGHGHEAVRIRR